MLDDLISVEEERCNELIKQLHRCINCQDALHVPHDEDPNAFFEGKASNYVSFSFDVGILIFCFVCKDHVIEAL